MKCKWIFSQENSAQQELTHWGRVTHICDGKLTNIGSCYGLSPGRRQAIIWTNAGITLIGPLGTNFSEILIGIQTFSFKKMYLKVSSAKWRPFYLGLNELTVQSLFRASLLAYQQYNLISGLRIIIIIKKKNLISGYQQMCLLLDYKFLSYLY